MKVKVTKQTTWTVETIPVQKRKCPTGGQKPRQSIVQKAIKIINKIK